MISSVDWNPVVGCLEVKTSHLHLKVLKEFWWSVGLRKQYSWICEKEVTSNSIRFSKSLSSSFCSTCKTFSSSHYFSVCPLHLMQILRPFTSCQNEATTKNLSPLQSQFLLCNPFSTEWPNLFLAGEREGSPNDTEELILTLCSGNIPGGVQGNI